jgi:hypothetical protein
MIDSALSLGTVPMPSVATTNQALKSFIIGTSEG